MSNPDYGGILVAVLNTLIADSALTTQLADYALPGGSTSQKNSIFSGIPPKDRAFPCVTLRDVMTGPVLRRQHEQPFKFAAMRLQIDVWSTSQAARPIVWELDNLLEEAFENSGMDTADWAIRDIDTSGEWRMIPVPQEFVSGSEQLQQTTKVFVVRAASKN